jgi:hypothetical protein
MLREKNEYYLSRSRFRALTGHFDVKYAFLLKDKSPLTSLVPAQQKQVNR